MRRKYIPRAVVTFALVGVPLYFYGHGQVPSRQAPLESLTPQNVAGLANAFNAAKNDVRVLLLLSPT
jgi:hypothetical protein